MTADLSARLSACGIQLVAEGKYCLFARDGFMALVEQRPDGFGAMGSAGLITEGGPAYLVWNEGQAWFVNRTLRQAADQAQVDLLRAFSADLEAALRSA